MKVEFGGNKEVAAAVLHLKLLFFPSGRSEKPDPKEIKIFQTLYHSKNFIFFWPSASPNLYFSLGWHDIEHVATNKFVKS